MHMYQLESHVSHCWCIYHISHATGDILQVCHVLNGRFNCPLPHKTVRHSETKHWNSL